jgi:hypothetical protein
MNSSDEYDSETEQQPIRLDAFISIGGKKNIKISSPETIKSQNNESQPKTIKQMKEIIIERAKNLEKEEYIEIFKILKKNCENYTQNSNGIFIALNAISPETLKEIYDFIEYRLENKKVLSERTDKNNAIFNSFLKQTTF